MSSSNPPPVQELKLLVWGHRRRCHCRGHTTDYHCHSNSHHILETSVSLMVTLTIEMCMTFNLITFTSWPNLCTYSLYYSHKNRYSRVSIRLDDDRVNLFDGEDEGEFRRVTGHTSTQQLHMHSCIILNQYAIAEGSGTLATVGRVIVTTEK